MSNKPSNLNNRPSGLIPRAAIIAALATPACVHPYLQKQIDEACAEDPNALIRARENKEEGLHAFHMNCEGEPAYEARYGITDDFHHGVALATTAPYSEYNEQIRLLAGPDISLGRRGVTVINREGQPILGPIDVRKKDITPEYYLLHTYHNEAYILRNGGLLAKYDEHFTYGDRSVVKQDGKWHLLAKNGEPESQSFEDASSARIFIDRLNGR